VIVPPSWVNAPPSVVWTKKLKLSPACTEPISASVISVLAERVTETDCGGKIPQSELVHVVAVLLAWTPMPLRKDIKRERLQRQVDVSRRGARCPGKAVRDDRVAAEGERLVDAAHADGDACAVERAADALHCRWIDAEPLGNDPYARPPRSRQSLTDSFLPRRGYRRPTKTLPLAPGPRKP
jgi:hypothetical protein